MRTLGMMALLSLVACVGPGTGHTVEEGSSQALVVQQDAPETHADGPFAGAWESCESMMSPDECSRYLLLQRGDRICGTWSYVASGTAYEGRVAARATSLTEARRTHVCGRPGSETDTECDEGWQRIDRPLRLCVGNLGDLSGPDGACFADYRAVPMPEGERDALQAQPWMQDCLSHNP